MVVGLAYLICFMGKYSASRGQIRACDELLVRYQLLLRGIESASMSTDTGIDLIKYSPKSPHPITIQVKADLESNPVTHKGELALDWWIPSDAPANHVALLTCHMIVSLSQVVVAAWQAAYLHGRIQTRSATPVDSVNEGGVLRAVDQQFSVHSQR